MTTFSTISGLPLPENTDVLDANGTFGGYANGLDTQLIPFFTTSTIRSYPGGDTTKPPRVSETGQLSVLTGTNVYDGTLLQQSLGSQTWRSVERETVIYKTADTARTSTITLANDPHLTVDLPAGQWQIEAYLAAGCPTNGVNFTGLWAFTGAGVAADVNGRAVSGMHSTVVENNAAATTMSFFNVSQATNLPTKALTNAADIPPWRREAFTINVTGGVCTMTLQWAQAVSNASAVTLLTGSHIVVRG